MSWSLRKLKHKLVPPRGSPRVATHAYALNRNEELDLSDPPTGGITAIMPAPHVCESDIKYCPCCGKRMAGKP